MWFKKREYVWFVLLVAVTRWLTRSHFLYDLDSVNFALALDRFDPASHQPHPPGYFLYVLAGRALRLLTGDANSAFVWLSIAASCGLVVLIYSFAEQWFGRSGARWAAWLFVFSPLGWFHGTVALTYIVEAFFSALVGWLCWRGISQNRPVFIIFAGAALALAAGFRQSSALFLLPLIVYSAYPMARRIWMQTVLAMGLTTAAWFVPMLWIAGPARYFGALWDLWTIVPGTESVAQSGIWMALARATTVAAILLLSLGFGVIFGGLRVAAPLSQLQRRFVLLWIAPALLFFTLVFLRFVNAGYLLLVTPPLFVVLGGRAAAWARSFSSQSISSQSTSSQFVPTAAMLALAALNTAIYVAAPLYCTYGEVQRFERDLTATLERIRTSANPQTDLLVGFDSHFLGYRHAAYYLPEYHLLQYPEVKYARGARVFSTYARDTEVLSALEFAQLRNIVFVPLPEGPEYREYVAHQLSVIPSPELHAIAAKGGTLLSAPISTLPQLFPRTIPRPDVYTRVYTSPRY